FSDLWENLDLAAMFHVEADKGNWQLFSDVFWVDLGADDVTGPFGLGSVDATIKEFIGSVNAGYRFLDIPVDPQLPEGPRLSLAAYAGARYTRFTGELDFKAISDADETVDWWA